MKKIIITTFLLLMFVTQNCFAQGKILPMKGSYKADPSELGIGLEEKATSTETNIVDVYILGFAPEIVLPDGTVKKINSVSDLEQGGEIVVGPGTGMVITLDDGSEITITNFDLIDTHIRIMSEVFNKADELVSQTLKLIGNELILLQGKVKSSLIKKRDKLHYIRTPEAVCAVRGTEFIVTRDPEAEVTNVYLKEGLVDVDNLHGKITELKAGETIKVDNNGQTTLSGLDQNQWNQLSVNTNYAQTEKDANSSMTWFIIIVVLLIGVSAFRYYRNNKV